MDAKTNLQQGIALARSGKREEARTLLLKVVEEEPKNLSAWLWLSDLVDDPQDRIIALENALTINPQQTQVRARLEQVKNETVGQTWKEPASPVETSLSPANETQPNWFDTQSQSTSGIADQFIPDLLNIGPDSSFITPETNIKGSLSDGDLGEISGSKPSQNRPPGPGIDPGLARLGEFSPHVSAEFKEESAKKLEDSLVQAKEALAAGKRQEGIDLLHQVVWDHPENEEGLRLLSESSYDMEEKVEALTKIVRLNPENLDAEEQLDQWAPLLKSPIDLGRWYQKQGDLDRALQSYTRASIDARSVSAKTEADRSVHEIEKLINEPQQLKAISPTWIIFRLSVGPVLLYLLLILIQGGLNIFMLDPVLVVGILFVIPGSIFLAISMARPTHPSWVPLFRALGEQREGLVHFLVGAVSVILLILPYSILILNAVARLELLRLANP